MRMCAYVFVLVGFGFGHGKWSKNRIDFVSKVDLFELEIAQNNRSHRIQIQIYKQSD